MLLLEKALSPNRGPGVVRGRPRPVRQVRIQKITASKAVDSCRCPAVVTRETGRARESPASTILVVNPPRDRPSASRSATALATALAETSAGFLSFDRSPCVTRWGVTSTGSVLVSTDHGPVDRHYPVRPLRLVTPTPQLIQDPGPHTLARPPIVNRPGFDGGSDVR